MKLKRILVETSWISNSDTISERGIDHIIDGENVSIKEYKAALNQKCVYKSERVYSDSGHVMPEGRSRETIYVTKQYIPLPF
jgi:hypothetical protein